MAPVTATTRRTHHIASRSSRQGLRTAGGGHAEVLRYLPPGPTTAEQFVRFIKWVRRERRAGRYLCFAVVPRGHRTAAGLFQLWPIEPGFGTAEMGFALDRSSTSR